jgi:hypothetical protein
LLEHKRHLAKISNNGENPGKSDTTVHVSIIAIHALMSNAVMEPINIKN